ncbi:MAG: 4Fe-4S dicluster domain-containing protein [Proteobacteria bacterium]|nr:4Fe-4S dicluster domain-containing protein [Pseudomonadota bacterium]NIS71688.1 4Fe-4S dicluster domain-containing protein [Pseudomonadota bacterium]
MTKKSGTIEINQELCKGCLFCVEACPKGLIISASKLNAKGYYPTAFREKGIRRELRECTGCCACAISCPEIAIEVYRG